MLIARGLAEQTGKRVRLSTKAIVGATSKGLSGQVDAMFVAGPPPDAAVILIGANDVTALNGIGASARRLGAAVRRLSASGAEVVVATCPDFGVVKAIPQPLRWTVRTPWAAAGPRTVRRRQGRRRCAGAAGLAGQRRVPARPHGCCPMTSFHPSAAGYALAAEASCCRRCARRSATGPAAAALLAGVVGRPEAGPRQLALRLISRLWRRPTPGTGPVVVPTGG